MKLKEPKELTESVIFLKLRSGRSWRITPDYSVNEKVVVGRRIRKDGTFEDFTVPVNSFEYIVHTEKPPYVNSTSRENGTGQNPLNDSIGDEISESD